MTAISWHMITSDEDLFEMQALKTTEFQLWEFRTQHKKFDRENSNCNASDGRNFDCGVRKWQRNSSGGNSKHLLSYVKVDDVICSRSYLVGGEPVRGQSAAPPLHHASRPFLNHNPQHIVPKIITKWLLKMLNILWQIQLKYFQHN